jgi:hypothetical protein
VVFGHTASAGRGVACDCCGLGGLLHAWVMLRPCEADVFGRKGRGV